MFKIRKGIFETNSSSTHSVSIEGDKKLDNPNLPVYCESNKVKSGFGKFGWEVDSYADQETKLSYLLTMIAEVNKRKDNLCSFYELEDFKKVEDVIKKHCKCDGIDIGKEPEIEKYKWYDGEYYSYNIDGYIDHQSTETYHCLDDFLNDWGVTIEEFIFSPNVWLNTDNDNY